MFGLTSAEYRTLARLTTPAKIQDFVNRIPVVGPGGDTCMSPHMVLRTQRAHCLEGAMLAALVLRVHGRRALVVDLKANRKDYDHVIAVWRERGFWGAISKTNYAVLRFREPIYRSVRELAMTYFHEYFTDDGKKTLRSYSQPVDLSRFDERGWMTSESDVWYVSLYLDHVKHYPIVPRSVVHRLRLADPIERRIGRVRQWGKHK